MVQICCELLVSHAHPYEEKIVVSNTLKFGCSKISAWILYLLPHLLMKPHPVKLAKELVLVLFIIQKLHEVLRFQPMFAAHNQASLGKSKLLHRLGIVSMISSPSFTVLDVPRHGGTKVYP
jgi:hypothetical protein